MSEAHAVVGMDRLPWLADEPKPTPKRERGGGRELLGWVLIALLLVGGASFWLGSLSQVPAPATRSTASATLPLSEPKQLVPDEQIQPVPQPEIPPAPEAQVQAPVRSSPTAQRLPRSVPADVAERVRRTIVTDEIDRVAQAQDSAAVKPLTPPVPNTQNIRLWPARYSAGASGRVVQIGAFGTRLQAKIGWKHMARAYPGVRRLPAVVVESRNSRGRPFYRFQIGTTSQAHSEILCQRMQQIRFSCAVVGLPGAKKAIER
jgi:outer membrane biosynthesis protein TonB